MVEFIIGLLMVLAIAGVVAVVMWKALEANHRPMPSIAEWYRILRQHHHYSKWEAIRHAIWLWM